MKITVDDVVQEVRKLATKYPDFNYKNQEGVDNGGMSCSYLAGMTSTQYKDSALSKSGLTYSEARSKGILGKGCIVGQALTRLGVSDETLLDFEEMGADYVVGSNVEPSDSHNYSKLMWLLVVQSLQDEGNNWAESVLRADKQVNL